MSSHKNQKRQLEELGSLYQQSREQNKTLFEALDLLKKAKDVYQEIMQSKQKKSFSVYTVNTSVKSLDLKNLKNLEFDWQKFYQE